VIGPFPNQETAQCWIDAQKRVTDPKKVKPPVASLARVSTDADAVKPEAVEAKHKTAGYYDIPDDLSLPQCLRRS
jgi:hypothetical protein